MVVRERPAKAIVVSDALCLERPATDVLPITTGNTQRVHRKCESWKTGQVRVESVWYCKVCFRLKHLAEAETANELRYEADARKKQKISISCYYCSLTLGADTVRCT